MDLILGPFWPISKFVFGHFEPFLLGFFGIENEANCPLCALERQFGTSCLQFSTSFLSLISHIRIDVKIASSLAALSSHASTFDPCVIGFEIRSN